MVGFSQCGSANSQMLLRLPLMSRFGRKRPVIFAISVKLERPLSGKADVQIVATIKSSSEWLLCARKQPLG